MIFNFIPKDKEIKTIIIRNYSQNEQSEREVVINIFIYYRNHILKPALEEI